MARELKQLIVEELSRQYEGLDRCVVLNFTGLSAEAASQIRDQLREHDITFRVVKNSLMAHTLKGVGLEALVGLLKGPCAVATGAGDVIQLMKTVTQTADGAQALTLAGGYAEGDVLAAADVRRLAVIPSREALQGRFLSAAQGTLRRLVGTMSAVTRNFVGVLDAAARKRRDSE